MPPEILATKKQRRVLALSVGLFLFAVYLFIYRGGFHSVDEVAMFAVTETMVKFDRVNIDQIAWIQWTTSQAEAQGFFGGDGHVYSKKGLALSLAQVPLYGLALLAPGVGMLQTVSLLNAGVTALTGLLIFMALHRLNFSPLTAVLTALIFGLATIAAVYAKYLFSEPLAGFWLLLAAYMLFAYRQEDGLRHIFIAGLAAGLAVLTRANNLFLLPVYVVYVLGITYQVAGNKAASSRETDSKLSDVIHNTQGVRCTQYVLRTSLPPLLMFALAVAIPGAILLTYNALRSGNPLHTGYDLTLFSPNILLGLYKLLFSPLRGLFVYSPVLLLSLPGWWLLRKTWPAEAWLWAGLVGVTLALFAAWSSGEGLSWGSRFLVPVIPFFALSLAPLVSHITGQVSGNKVASSKIAYLLPATCYLLLVFSFIIQVVGVAINPWVFLGQLQADFGGEFFLENTAALYNFRYSQVVGQLQTWSVAHSDLVWWQPWGFDYLAFGLSLALVVVSGWFLWRHMAADRRPETAVPGLFSTIFRRLSPVSRLLFACYLATLLLATYLLLVRYNVTDQQFGPPNDAYTRALTAAAAQAAPDDQIVTVAQYPDRYHVLMNRFKARLPITGLARQTWPPPPTALPLLRDVMTGPNVWLVTVGFQPAASDNAAEQWLAANTFKAGDEWLGESVRLARYATRAPQTDRAISVTLGQDEIKLTGVRLMEGVKPGEALPVELTWLPVIQPQADYHLFLQLINADGVLVAQHDGLPNGGYSPTSTWRPGQPITSRHALILPDNLPVGVYRLITGFYNPVTGARLSVSGGGDFVELDRVHVER